MKNKIGGIEGKITSSMIKIIILLSVCVVVVSSFFEYRSTMKLIEQNLTSVASIGAQDINTIISKYTNHTEEITKNYVQMLVESADDKTINNYFNSAAEWNGFLYIESVDAEGNTSKGKNIKDSEYFITCKNTLKSTVSSIEVNESDGKCYFNVISPIIDNGKFKGAVYGAVDSEVLCKAVDKIKTGDDTTTYILDKNATVVAHMNRDLVKSRDNVLKTSKTNSKLRKLASIESDMIKGKEGFGKYSYGGVTKILGYAQIENSDGWSIGVACEINKYLYQILSSIAIIIIMSVICSFFAIKKAGKLGKGIADPIKLLSERLGTFAEGDLKSDMPQINTDDETQIIVKAIEKTVVSLRGYIEDISMVLDKLANKDLVTVSNTQYKGDFTEIERSLSEIRKQLNSTFCEIRQATSQVNGGAEQVSKTAQELSSGATEQASVVEELTASINEVTNKTKITASNAKNTDSIVEQLVQEIKNSDNEMKNMVEAMREIGTTSGNIGEIINTIDSIAEQTNLLALNAAIEAARAGEAGKGFAVVAEKVRLLAEDSSKAVKNTEDLIKNSVNAVKKGQLIADNTSKSLKVVVDKAQNAVKLVNDISAAAEEQSVSLEEIDKGIQQITDVIQSNSAIAEESAAASQELTAQSETLDEMLAQFKLK